MKLPLFKSATIVSAILLATSACAQPTSTTNTSGESSKNVPSVTATSTLTAATDSHLRKVLLEVGIKTEIVAITTSNLPNMYEVDLVGQPPLHSPATVSSSLERVIRSPG